MLTMEDVRKRKNYLIMQDSIEESNIESLINTCKKTTSINILESYFRNWTYTNSNNQFAFVESVNVLEQFINNSKSNSDKQKAISLFREMVLPRCIDMKKARNIIKSFTEANNIGYELLYECNTYISCDRILNNHDRLVKKGINNIPLSEASILSEEALDEYVTNVCEFIDNINMPFTIKYNVALENTLYLLDKKGINYSRQNVLESINDYFLINSDPEKINAMNIIVKKNEMYLNERKDYIVIESVQPDMNKEDEDLDVVLDSEKDIEDELDTAFENVSNIAVSIVDSIKTLPDKTPESMKGIIKKLYTKSANNIIDETPNFLIWMRKFIIFGTFAVSPYITVITFFVDKIIEDQLQQKETEKIIKSFKKEKESANKKLAKLVNENKKERLRLYIKELEANIKKLEDYQDSLYTEDENDKRFDEKLNSSLSESVEGFEYLDYITLEEYINQYHIKVVDQMYKTTDMIDSFLKSNYPKLYSSECVMIQPIDELKRFENVNTNTVLNYIGIDNRIYVEVAKFLGVRYNELNDTIVNQRDVLSDICDSLQLKIDYDFCLMYEGDEDMYTIYLAYNTPLLIDNESSNIVSESVLPNNIIKPSAMIMALESEVSKLVNNDLEYLLDFVDDYIDQLDMETVNCVGQFSVVASDIISPKVLLDLFEEKADYIRNNVFDNSKYVKIANIQEGIDAIKNTKSLDNKYLSMYDSYNDIINLNESIDLVKQITINETSFVNTMKLARERLKKNILKLSDKEKQLSRQLDFAVEGFVNKLQMAATNNNREAVIKGSIIPSASKVLKIAIGTGALYAVNPAIATIGALGGIAASKHATSKERQYILDEIDIQLKVIDKKIQLADRSDDMKAMEQLMKIQQKLKREKSRIEYHRKDYIPSAKND